VSHAVTLIFLATTNIFFFSYIAPVISQSFCAITISSKGSIVFYFTIVSDRSFLMTTSQKYLNNCSWCHRNLPPTHTCAQARTYTHTYRHKHIVICTRTHARTRTQLLRIYR